MDIGDVCDVLKPIGTKLWKCGVSLLLFVLKLICSLRKLGLFYMFGNSLSACTRRKSTSFSYTTVCPPVRRENPRALVIPQFVRLYEKIHEL